MEREMLRQWTMGQEHWGSNNITALDNFVRYSEMCQDSMNIFRYMEEKSICTFMPQFWLKKAEMLFEVGDYEGCFSSLQEALFRKEMFKGDDEHNDSPTPMIDIEKKIEQYTSKMAFQMKKFSHRGKRSVEQFHALSNEKQDSQNKRINQLLSIYNNKYAVLKDSQKKSATVERQKLPQSWMFTIYQQIDNKDREIEAKISQENKHMETPLRSKYSKKISRTVDSVELQKKKNTIQKSKYMLDKIQQTRNIDCPSKQLNPLNSTEIKRKVSFDTSYIRENRYRSNIQKKHQIPIRFSSMKLKNRSERLLNKLHSKPSQQMK